MNMNTIACHDKVPKEEIPNMESMEGKSIIFLDYDGVVNTLRIEDDAKDLRSSYGYPNDNKVNDTQAIRWLLLFCRKFNYYIIVTSTWRLHDNYKECLINAGFEDGYRILGALPDGDRWEQIREFFIKNKLSELSLVFDDDTPSEEYKGIRAHHVKCDTHNGFHAAEYFKAMELYEKFKKGIEAQEKAIEKRKKYEEDMKYYECMDTKFIDKLIL